METGWEKEIASLLGESKLLLDTASLEKYSKDYYWYSPILELKLKNKLADGIVLASNEQEVRQLLAYAYRREIPVTVRGAGTGNYGQAVPLEGGIVLDVSGLDQIIELGDGYVRVQCGMKMGVLESFDFIQALLLKRRLADLLAVVLAESAQSRGAICGMTMFWKQSFIPWRKTRKD
jgi:hypothetical protein